MADHPRLRIDVEDGDLAAGPDGPQQLRDRPLGARRVREGGDRQDDVERRVVDRQGAGVASLKLDQMIQPLALGDLARNGEHGRARIDAHDAARGSYPAGHGPGDDAGAAADVERALARGNLEQVQVRLADGGLVLALAAQLQEAGQLTDPGFFSRRDHALVPGVHCTACRLAHDALHL